MARIKLGSIVTDLAGSAGGSTVQNSRYGHILRNKPQQVFSRTSSQYSIRSLNTAMHAGWKALTDQQRLVWNYFAKTKPVFNKSVDKHPLSGHSLWLKLQFPYLFNGLSLQPDVYKAFIGPFGPELIANGDFSSPAGWTLSAESSIHDGKLFLLSTLPGHHFSYTSCIFPPLPSDFWVQMLSEDISGSVLFGNGMAPWTYLLSGFNTYIYTPVNPNPLFYFNASGVSAATIDNLSVKRILT